VNQLSCLVAACGYKILLSSGQFVLLTGTGLVFHMIPLPPPSRQNICFRICITWRDGSVSSK
jgi:hypothetical protein